MKKLSLIIIYILIPCLSYAGILEVIARQRVASGGVNWTHILELDDNAATTVVLNTGTDSTSWVAGANTSTYHSATAKEGTGAFLVTASSANVASPSTWTATKFTYQIWVYFNDATAVLDEELVGCWDGTAPDGNHEFLMDRESGEAQLTFHARGASVNSGILKTTNFSPSISTWYSILVSVDATVSPWTITASYGTDEASMTTLTYGAWSSNPDTPTFADPFRIGSPNVTNTMNGIVDNVRLKVD